MNSSWKWSVIFKSFSSGRTFLTRASGNVSHFTWNNITPWRNVVSSEGGWMNYLPPPREVGSLKGIPVFMVFIVALRWQSINSCELANGAYNHLYNHLVISRAKCQNKEFTQSLHFPGLVWSEWRNELVIGVQMSEALKLNGCAFEIAGYSQVSIHHVNHNWQYNNITRHIKI